MSSMYQIIQSLCESKGISGYRLCKDVGISPSHLTEMKMGRHANLSTKNAQKVADYFGVTTAYLLGEEGEEETKKAPSPSEERVLDEYEKEFLELSKDLPPEMKKSLLTLVRMYVQDKEGK